MHESTKTISYQDCCSQGIRSHGNSKYFHLITSKWKSWQITLPHFWALYHFSYISERVFLLLFTRSRNQGISIEYVLGIQYFEKVLVLDIQYIFEEVLEKVLILSDWRSNTQYFFQEFFSHFNQSSKFSRKI